MGYTMLRVLGHRDHTSSHMVTHCVLSDLFSSRHIRVSLSMSSCQILWSLHGTVPSILLVNVHATDIHHLDTILLLSTKLFGGAILVSGWVRKRSWILHGYTSNSVNLFRSSIQLLSRAHNSIFRVALKTDAVSFLPLVETLICDFCWVRDLIIWNNRLLDVNGVLSWIYSSFTIISSFKQLYILHLLISRILLTFLNLTIVVISSSADTFSPCLILIRWILLLGTELTTSRLTLFGVSRCWTILGIALRVNWPGWISSHSNCTLIILVVNSWWTSNYNLISHWLFLLINYSTLTITFLLNGTT